MRRASRAFPAAWIPERLAGLATAAAAGALLRALISLARAVVFAWAAPRRGSLAELAFELILVALLARFLGVLPSGSPWMISVCLMSYLLLQPPLQEFNRLTEYSINVGFLPQDLAAATVIFLVWAIERQPRRKAQGEPDGRHGHTANL